MADQRLIDADAFIEDIETEIVNLRMDGLKGTPRPCEELYDIIDRIGEQPTVDAVPVVRCKDCKHFDENNACYCHAADENGTPIFVREHDFCSYGEKEDYRAVSKPFMIPTVDAVPVVHGRRE